MEAAALSVLPVRAVGVRMAVLHASKGERRAMVCRITRPVWIRRTVPGDRRLAEFPMACCRRHGRVASGVVSEFCG